MSILVNEEEHPTLVICGSCRHGTEQGIPCRWCAKHRRVSTHFTEHEDKSRIIAQDKFNKNLHQGII